MKIILELLSTFVNKQQNSSGFLYLSSKTDKSEIILFLFNTSA